MAVDPAAINTSQAPCVTACKVAKRSEIKSWCGEKLSYGRVSQSGSKFTRKLGANHAISSASRCASSGLAVMIASNCLGRARPAMASASAEAAKRGRSIRCPGLGCKDGSDDEREGKFKTGAEAISPSWRGSVELYVCSLSESWHSAFDGVSPAPTGCTDMMMSR